MLSHPRERIVTASAMLGALIIGTGFGYHLGRGGKSGPAASAANRTAGNAGSPTGDAPALQSPADPAQAKPSPPLSRSPAEALQLELLGALREPNPMERFLRIAGAIQKLTPQNWHGMIAALAEEKTLGRAHADVRVLLAQRAGEIVGREALQFYLGEKDSDAIRAALTGWAIRDPADALAWLGREADAEIRRRFMGAAIRGLALTEPDLAIRELENIPLERRQNYTQRFVESIARGRSFDETESLVRGMIERAAASHTLQDPYLANIFWDLARLKIDQARATGDVRGLGDWMNKYVGQPYVPPATVGVVVERYVQADPLTAFQWLESYNRQHLAAGQPTTVGYDVLMAAWTQRDGAAPVAEWLGQMSAHPHYDRLAQRYSGAIANKDPEAALRWAGTIKDASMRAAALNTVAKLRPPKS